MAGPLSGIAGQQQIPLSQPSQLDQNNGQVRGNQDEQEQNNLNRVPPQGAAAAETNDTATNNQNDLQARADELLAAQNDNGEQGETTRRGSLIDVVI